ncbi:MAG: zinc ABC transporter solute-binding protein [Gemmatimonadetes bacterium]|nr:zinc ABC transporter solute-binding protein [Gemmatimonadota bacterium]
MRSRALTVSIAVLFFSGALCTGIIGCAQSDNEGGARKAGEKIRVTATVGMVGDLARNVGGEHVEVTTLMGPGVDPHLYKASEGDIARLSGADIVFYNGLLLEGKMADVLVKVARRGKPTVAVSETIDESRLREPPEFQGHYDPHIWFDVSLWAGTIPAVVAALSELDPAHAKDYEANGAAYARELAALHEEVRAAIATIPADARVVVTAHDAFGYFGVAYDIEVIGLQGVSTLAEYGIRDVQRIVDLITSRSVRAVFVESSVPRRSIEAVVAGCRAKGHEVKIGGELFSDAMGEEGTPEGTYIGMVRHNVNTIVESLR